MERRILMNAISNVYNYYMSSHVGRKQSNKYDTHQKNELKNIYNSIVKMSKESPVYIFDHSKEAYKFAINIKEEARELKNTLSALTAAEDSGSLFGQKIATSSDPDMVSAEYLGRKSGAEETDGFTISVEQLAGPQKNTGNFLPPNRLKLIPNNYSFDIQSGGLSYEFQFHVSHQDTNRSIQERLAALINKSNIGVQANVITDEESKNTALTLTSNTTGSEDGKLHFHVTDEHSSQESGAVEYLGLDQVSSDPQNAVFTLDGVRHTALSNTFTINQSFELTLHKETKEQTPAIIGFKADIDTVSDNIQEMTRQYNSMIRLSGSYAGRTIQNNLLQKNISSVAKQHENTLEAIGLQLTQDGSLEVDEQLLTQSLTEDMTDTIDSLIDFKTTLMDKTEEVMLNPMDYVDKKIVAYPNPGKTFANPYLTSVYSGMLFNSYC